MGLRRYALPFLLILMSFFLSCYSNSIHQEVPVVVLDHNHFVDDEEAIGYHSQAYPSYVSILEDGKFVDLIDQRASDDNLLPSFERFSKLLLDNNTAATLVNVNDFGAKGDGTHDDTEWDRCLYGSIGDPSPVAFEKAWEVACESKGSVVLVVPKNYNYLLKPIRFSGPCTSLLLAVQIHGSIEASDNISDYGKDRRDWLIFDHVQNLLVQGGGTINGNGKIWWQNSCKINKSLPCRKAPTAIAFFNCKNLVVKNLKVQDAQQMHVSFQKCRNIYASNLIVTAPETSPNTDGIHVSNTRKIHISNSVIATGDDCISIVTGSKKVEATDITCGPGHGISIGSLGEGNSKAYVSGVTINGAKLSRTKNGVRIKTWQGGSGSASNIKFQNIEMDNVANPIIIDQSYCDQDKPCKEQDSAVQVENVVYENITGTSASEVAIKLDCSKSFPCEGIIFEDIDLKFERGEAAKALCNNVQYLTQIGEISPNC